MRTEIRPWRLMIKAFLLFVIANMLFAVVDPPFYHWSLYNGVFPGRVRLPYGGDGEIYSVMVDNLDVMMASHEIAVPKAADEFRVVIIGDSSVWGEGAHVSQSISVLWNADALTCGGRNMKFYNLAYPHPSVVKDLVILDKAMEFDPDLVVWFVTLNALTPRRLSPFIRANAERAGRIMDQYAIPFDTQDVSTSTGLDAFYERTLAGRSSDLARMLKLQVFGVLWTISGNDAYEPANRKVVRSNNVDREETYKGLQTTQQLKDEIIWQALDVGKAIAGPAPVLIVNEPMFIATGTNSDVRYNNGYPRWAYDYYRAELQSKSQTNQWHYLDLWNSVPGIYFPDGVIHISPEGRRIVIQNIDPVIQNMACR